jgi:hypothetical protein
VKKRKAGRPEKFPDDPVTYLQAVQEIKENLMRRFHDKDIVEKMAPKIGTLRNKVSAGELRTWKQGRFAVLSKAEVLKLVG